MKKRILPILLSVLTGFGAYAQYYSVSAVNAGFNPGNLNMDDEQPSTGVAGFTDVHTPGSSGWSGAQTIPFSFNFDGNDYLSYDVNASGVVTFTTSPTEMPTETNEALPSAMIPDNSICAWGMNLSGGNDGVVSKTYGTAPNRQHWISWSSASSTELGAGAWAYWSIVLEETSNKIYVVDVRNYSAVGTNMGLTVGVQIDNSTAVSLASSPDVISNNTATGGSEFTAVDNSFYLFAQGTQPADDAANLSVNNGAYQQINTSANVTGTIMNFGSATITSMSVAYSANGGTPVVDNVSGLSIAPGATYDFVLPTTWTPGAEGIVALSTEVMMVNGNVDADISNNTATTNVLVHPPSVPRKPLLEAFTSSTCGPCAPGNANVATVMGNYAGQFSKVNYQMSWPGTGDPYYTDEGGVRRNFYGVNSIPDISTDGGAGINSNNYVASTFTDALDVPAFLNMTVSGQLQTTLTYAVVDGALVMTNSARVISVTSDVDPIIDIASGLTGFIAVLEDQTTDNVKSNGETEFEYVMKKMIPDASGTDVGALTEGVTYTLAGDYEIMGDYRLPGDATDPIDLSVENSFEGTDDLSAVAWVQDLTTGQVWQSENAPIIVLEDITNVTVEVVDGVEITTVDGQEYVLWDGLLSPLGVNSISAANVSMYPNPANDVLNISGVNGLANVTVFDMSGRVVLSTALESGAISVSDLNVGIYQVTIEQNGSTVTERINIAR